MAQRYVVAVSGGVDSVVLLDMLAARLAVGTKASPELQGEERTSGFTSEVQAEGCAPPLSLVVAHFDHGIRESSAKDARFVGELAQRYGLPYETTREELGPHASEELARTRRYAFLRQVAEKYDATIVTAHHMNDIAETVAINVQRGTGWRGLACLASDIERPLLGKTKADLVYYAHEHNLRWREDETNASDVYLRNRLRPRLDDEDMVRQLAALRARQVELREMIDEEVGRLMDGTAPYSRYVFAMVPPEVASELLRHLTQGRLTPPQRDRALLAIRVQRPRTHYEAGAGIQLDFTSRHFAIQMLK